MDSTLMTKVRVKVVMEEIIIFVYYCLPLTKTINERIPSGVRYCVNYLKNFLMCMWRRMRNVNLHIQMIRSGI